MPTFYEKLTPKNQASFNVELPNKLSDQQLSQCFFFHGVSGGGKTFQSLQFAKSWLKEAKKYGTLPDSHEWDNLKFYKWYEIKEIAQKSFGNTEESRQNAIKLERIQQTPFLIIDDIGTEKATEFVEDLIYKIIDYRYENQLQTIFTSNFSLSDITEKYHSRIARRIDEMVGINKFNLTERFVVKTGITTQTLDKFRPNLTPKIEIIQPKSDDFEKNKEKYIKSLAGMARTNTKGLDFLEKPGYQEKMEKYEISYHEIEAKISELNLKLQMA